MVRVKRGVDAERIESLFPELKECDNEHLVEYIDVVEEDDELWVLLPSSVDCIDCNGEL